MTPVRGGTGGGVAAALREHRLFLCLLAVAAAVRVCVAVAYAPALFFTDSWGYLGSAYDATLVRRMVDRPSGYGVFIKILSIAGRNLDVLVAAQHVAGLAIGILAYLLLGRLHAPRWTSLGVAAIILLDAYLLALEQHVLPEALFGLLLMASAYLLVTRDSTAALAASGVLLAAAATVRTAALFAVPVWLAYVLLRQRPWRRIGIAAAALALPLVVYPGAQAASGGGFSLNGSGGWFLYGRVAQIADCSSMHVAPAARGLCEPTGRPRQGAAFYVWSDRSPAVKTFGHLGGPRTEEADRVLGQFARATIRARPGAYIRMVSGDVLRYFRPGTRSLGRSDTAIHFPARLSGEQLQPAAMQRFWGRPLALRFRPPAGAVRGYARVVHVPRWALGLLAILGVATTLLAAVPDLRPHLRGTSEGLVLLWMGLAMVVGAAATSDFIIRYLVPSAPLILCGGTLVACALARNAGILRQGRARAGADGGRGDVAAATRWADAGRSRTPRP